MADSQLFNHKDSCISEIMQNKEADACTDLIRLVKELIKPNHLSPLYFLLLLRFMIKCWPLTLAKGYVLSSN